MNRTQQSVLLAGLLACALAGCSSTRGGSEETGAGATASGTAGTSPTSNTATSGTAGTEASTAGSTATPAQPAGMPGSAMPGAGAMPNAVVMAIESMPRQSTTAAAEAAVGGSGTAGTTGSSGEDKIYRITLRMDDGTTRVVTQDKAPTYRMGDRVNMTDGAIMQ